MEFSWRFVCVTVISRTRAGLSAHEMSCTSNGAPCVGSSLQLEDHEARVGKVLPSGPVSHLTMPAKATADFSQSMFYSQQHQIYIKRIRRRTTKF